MGKISEYTAATTATGAEEIVGNQSSVTKKFTLTTIFSKIGAILESIGGDARGTDAVDFQFYRNNDDEVAGGAYSFIAGGARNKITDVATRGKEAIEGHAEGLGNQVLDWQGHAEGNKSIADGKITHAEGNNCICVANDSHAEGNRTFAGGRYYESVSTGSEDAGDGLGVKQYVLINDLGTFGTEGDVTSFFPNLLTDNITTRYAAGAQMDDKGNIYSSGFTPAVWTGDVPTTPNDLKWAMHSSCYVRGPSEGDTTQVQICKAVYTIGSGTKVYYDGDMPYASIIGIYSSYAPTVFVDGSKGGNGQHSEGRLNSAWGDGAHVEGEKTRAWGPQAHAEGSRCYAIGQATHAEGIDSRALSTYARAEGAGTTSSGTGSKSSGGFTTASGDWSKTDGYQTAASARCAVADGELTTAAGTHSKSSGKESKALRNYEQAYSAGKRSTAGDDQIIRVTYSRTVTDVGWWQITLLDQIEDGKAYHFDTMVIGRQIAGAGGIVGNTFAYKFQGCFMRDDTTYTVIGTPIRTLIGRSAGMSGDGLTTGERMTWVAPAATYSYLRYDGVDDQTYRIQTHSWIQELTV